MKYHYSRQEGWLGNPCGLVLFKGQYHLFFLLNPDSPRYGALSWGHAVSDDLISWEERPIALSPVDEYSCNSGSVIVHDGRIWLFYSSISSDQNARICVAYSDDGVSFTRVKESAVSIAIPESVTMLHDPFVFRYGNGFRLIAGAGQDGIATVLQYVSDDLLNWRLSGNLLSDFRYGRVIENPIMAETDGKWVFIIQTEKHIPTKLLFAVGEYDGERFVFDNDKEPFGAVELCDDLLYPVTAKDDEGNTLVMAWMFSQKMNEAAISCPRLLTVNRKGEACMMPYGDLNRRASKESSFVSYEDGRLRVFCNGRVGLDKAYRECPEISCLEDVGMVEVFINGGTETVSLFIC